MQRNDDDFISLNDCFNNSVHACKKIVMTPFHWSGRPSRAGARPSQVSVPPLAGARLAGVCPAGARLAGSRLGRSSRALVSGTRLGGLSWAFVPGVLP